MRRAIASLAVGLVVLGAAPPESGGDVAFAAPLESGSAPFAFAAPLESGAARWNWPVDPPHQVVRPFIAPATPYSAGHRGIDIRAPDGTVYAPTAGVVHFAGVVVDRPVLSIRHAGGLTSSYEPVTSDLVAGQAVRRGDVIGAVVAGHCALPCLHFGVRLDGEYMSPLVYLGGIPRAVLLPTRRG